MSYQTPPPGGMQQPGNFDPHTGQPIHAGAQAAAAQATAAYKATRRKRWPLALTFGLVGLVVGFGIGSAGGGTSDPSSPAAQESSPAQEEPAGEQEPTTEPVDSEPEEVTAKDLQVKMKITEKQCFGSAGCNVQAEPVLDFTSNGDGVKAGGFEVEMTITGDESGPIISTVSVHSGGTYDIEPVLMSTSSQSVKIKAKVTDVYYYE